MELTVEKNRNKVRERKRRRKNSAFTEAFFAVVIVFIVTVHRADGQFASHARLY